MDTTLKTPYPAGRIWLLVICMSDLGKWYIFIGLSKHSSPVRPKIVFLVEAREGTLVTGRAKVPLIRYECSLRDQPTNTEVELLGPEE